MFILLEIRLAFDYFFNLNIIVVDWWKKITVFISKCLKNIIFLWQNQAKILAIQISVFGWISEQNFGRNQKLDQNRNRNIGRNRYRNRKFPITNWDWKTKFSPNKSSHLGLDCRDLHAKIFNLIMASSRGLVVKVLDSWSRGRGFESCRILDLYKR